MNRQGMTWESIVIIVIVVILLVLFMSFLLSQAAPGQSAIADFAEGMM